MKKMRRVLIKKQTNCDLVKGKKIAGKLLKKHKGVKEMAMPMGEEGNKYSGLTRAVMQHEALNVERPAKRGKESKVRLYERSLFFFLQFFGELQFNCYD